MKKVYILFLLIFGSVGVWGQVTVFTDDFSTNQSATYTTTGVIGASAWSVNRSGDDWGGRRNTSPAQLELTNDVGAIANVNGWAFANTPTTSFTAPYNSTLNLNTGLVTWTFNMRQIRTDPSGFGVGSYGVAFILAGSGTNGAAGTTGYAVALGQTGPTDAIRLLKYNNGMQGAIADIIVSNTMGLTDFGAEYLSIKVTYLPSTNTWELFLRNDGTTAFADPTTGTLVSQGTAVDNAFTGTSLGFMGGYWQGSTGATQTAFFDNTKVTVAPAVSPNITVTPNALSGFTSSPGVPSAEQTYTVGGSNLTTDIVIAPPAGFEISLTTGAGFVSFPGNIPLTQSSGNVPTTTIFVRMNSATIGTNTGNITHTSAGSNNPTVALTGNVVPLVPVAYLWIGVTSDWQVPTNWVPTRLFPATNDSLLFKTTTNLITNVPSQTVGYIGASLSTVITLQAAVTGNSLTIGDLTGFDFFVEAGSSFNISSANALTLNLVTGATASISGAMTFTAGAHKLTATVASAITFNSGAVFTAGTGFTGNAFGTNPASVNSVVFVSGSRYQQFAGSSPFALGQPLSVVVFNTGSLFKLMANLFPAVSGRTYANFELDFATASLPLTGASLLSIDTLTVTSGSISFGMTTAGMNVKGNIVVAVGGTLGFAPATTGTLNFNGTVPQSITNAGTLSFNAFQNVTINNASGLTLNSPITLAGILTFTNGLVNTTGANLLVMAAGSSVTGASNASFVNGPVSKLGNTPFIFPIGKTNTGPAATRIGYAALGISNFTGGVPGDEFSAEYKRGNAQAMGPITAAGLHHVSSCDYWTLTKDAGTAIVDITLHWVDSVNNCSTASPYVNNLPSLTVAHFNGASWDAYGIAGVTSGTTGAGTVTWGIPQSTTFGIFAIGSIDFNNPLPITINYFNGAKQNGNHLLNWKVTCVSTPSATIELERSIDGRNYNSIYSIFATAVRCQQPFDYSDNSPAKGVNYYRLKMTDVDGKVTYSSIVSLINASKGIDVMNIAPNPIVNGAFNIKISTAEKMQMELVVIDMQGRVMMKQAANMIAGFNVIPVNVKQLAAGTYQLFGNTADGRTRVLRFVVQ